MAATKATTKAPKPAKSPKAAKAEGAASVGPIEGTLESKPDTVAQDAAPVKKNASAPVCNVDRLIKDQFSAIKETLVKTSQGPKKPRQLRWALKALEAAKDAALTHLKHNV